MKVIIEKGPEFEKKKAQAYQLIHKFLRREVAKEEQTPKKG